MPGRRLDPPSIPFVGKPLHHFCTDDKERSETVETETLVTQFTCDRGGVICDRPPDPKGTCVSEDLRGERYAANCLTQQAFHKVE